jgi:deazaflavin-dependent oxidoreductase (nitroreductase family)
MEDVKDERFIYLTTIGRKSGKPHTVELWFAFSKGAVYLSHEGDHTDWMKNIAKHGSVSMRIDGVESKGDARITTETEDARETGKKMLYEKYYGPTSQEVIDDWFELSTVVEVTPN